MKYYILLVLFFVGCASTPRKIETPLGKAIEVKTMAEVLEVIGTEKSAIVTYTENGFVVFVKKKEVYHSPIVVESNNMTDLKILINQYSNDGWNLIGGISASSKLGTTTFYATLVK